MTDIHPLYPVQQKIKDAIRVQWDRSLPVAIQMEARSGKTFILESLLSDSNISSVLVITMQPQLTKKSLKNIAFVDTIIPDNSMVGSSTSRRSEESGFSDYDAIILDDPWFWPSTSYYKNSEEVFVRVADYTNHLLALGRENARNVWSIDALIPKYSYSDVVKVEPWPAPNLAG